MSTTDRIRAIHRAATSSPWDEWWSIEADSDEHGYAREWVIETGTGWLASFAYVQHLEMFIEAKRHMGALTDLADAARRLLDAETNPDLRTAESDLGAALARLDGEEET